MFDDRYIRTDIFLVVKAHTCSGWGHEIVYDSGGMACALRLRFIRFLWMNITSYPFIRCATWSKSSLFIISPCHLSCPTVLSLAPFSSLLPPLRSWAARSHAFHPFYAPTPRCCACTHIQPPNTGSVSWKSLGDVFGDHSLLPSPHSAATAPCWCTTKCHPIVTPLFHDSSQVSSSAPMSLTQET